MSTWFGFDRARVDVLHRLTSRAVDELSTIRSDDPDAAEAMRVLYARDLLWGIEGGDYLLAPTGNVALDTMLEAEATVREHVGQAIATSRTSTAGLPDYVVVEYGYAYGLGVGGVTIVSTSGNIFTGPSAGVATPGPSVAARIGYIAPMEEDYSGEEVDEFVEGFDVSAGRAAV